MQFSDSRDFYNHSSGVGNIPGAVGMGVAIDTILKAGVRTIEQHNLALRNRLYHALKRKRDGTVVSAPPGCRSAG